jgi:hypothetical protein
LLFVTARLSWLGAELTGDVLPLIGEMLVTAVIFFALWPVAMVLSKWVRARLGDGAGDGASGRRPEGSLGEG